MEKQNNSEELNLSEKDLYESEMYKIRVSNGFLTIYTKETDEFGNIYWEYTQNDLNWKIKNLIEELIKKQTKEVTNGPEEQPKV
jgi:hypothetical protein